jgi:hypothetical protein
MQSKHIKKYIRNVYLCFFIYKEKLRVRLEIKNLSKLIENKETLWETKDEM